MPDYEIDATKKKVVILLYGNAINEKYTKLLKENKDLSFEGCLLLDAVQKGRVLHEEDLQQDEKEMLTLSLADIVLDAVGDEEELTHDAIIVAQKQIQKL